MSQLLIRLGLLSLLCIGAWLFTKLAKRFVNHQRKLALKAAPPDALPESGTGETAPSTAVRILSFSSPDCHQCKRLQAPALERVLETRGEGVTVITVDATTEHDLVQTYRVLTVPSTVILDTEGHAHAINYGFANTDCLLTQVDEILAKTPSLQ